MVFEKNAFLKSCTSNTSHPMSYLTTASRTVLLIISILLFLLSSVSFIYFQFPYSWIPSLFTSLIAIQQMTTALTKNRTAIIVTLTWNIIINIAALAAYVTFNYGSNKMDVHSIAEKRWGQNELPRNSALGIYHNNIRLKVENEVRLKKR